MFWTLEHRDISKDDRDQKIYAKARIILQSPTGGQMTISDVPHQTEYNQCSRTALMDAAYKLEQIARQMKAQAEDMQ